MCVYKKKGKREKICYKRGDESQSLFISIEKNTTTEELREEEEKREKEGIKTYQGHGKKLMNC